MNKCNYHDCFSCPYSDCISDTPPRGASKKRKKLTQDEAKKHRIENNRRYYYKNRAKISELHRKNYQQKKQREAQN